MDLTPRERDELDTAAGSNHVYVLRRVHPPTPMVATENLATVPIQTIAEEYLWRWDDISGMWEYYGDPGSTVPTDIYRPNMSGRQIDEWQQRNDRRRYDATPPIGRAILPPYDDGQIATTGYAQAADMGEPVVITGTTAWAEVGPADMTFAYTRMPQRGNNYDIVHKSTD